MVNYKNSHITLMVQSGQVVFCYYNFSPLTIKEFEDNYGEKAWKSSRPAIKVYKIDKEGTSDIQTIDLDEFADNWYINLNEGGSEVFVKLGRILPTKKFVTIAISNIVTTPRNKECENSEIKYLDLKKRGI